MIHGKRLWVVWDRQKILARLCLRRSFQMKNADWAQCRTSPNRPTLPMFFGLPPNTATLSGPLFPKERKKRDGEVSGGRSLRTHNGRAATRATLRDLYVLRSGLATLLV